MPATGLLTVRVYTSKAELPVSGAMIHVTAKTDQGDQLLATRITDESGKTTPITIATPERSESLSPGTAVPFTNVDISVDAPDFERALIENAQIFAGVLTLQNLELLPIEAQPDAWNMTEIIPITAQEL